LELEQDFFQNFVLVLILIGLILEKNQVEFGGGGVDFTFGFQTQP
jgi:hypothetical protein